MTVEDHKDMLAELMALINKYNKRLIDISNINKPKSNDGFLEYTNPDSTLVPTS